MIKSRELREGNFIQRVKSGTAIVVTPDHIKSISEGDTDYDSIPLTPEILDKIGFEEAGFEKWKGGNTFSKEDIDGNVIQVRGKTISLGGQDSCTGGMVFELECDCLHQFQNLYFALTNEELIINL